MGRQWVMSEEMSQMRICILALTFIADVTVGKLFNKYKPYLLICYIIISSYGYYHFNDIFGI